MNKTKVLVLGASGMVGHVLALRLKEFPDEFEVFTASRKQANGQSDFIVDAANFNELRSLLELINPDVCINAIGVLNRAADDLEISQKLNTELPLFLSNVGIERSFHLIHISTDCVFSGKRGNYSEMDTPDAHDNYGLTKIAGEQIDPRHLVIRTSVIGPEIRPQAIGLFHWFTSQEGAVMGYKNVIWTGVTTLTLADAIIHAIANNTHGLLQLVNNKSISKCALIDLIHSQFPNKTRVITSTSNPVSNKSLLNTREDWKLEVLPYAQMITELRNWMERYPALYGFYLTQGA
jgi:dTDP-4-dehydrorhamnose reductase